ncbi:MAG: hypothetical protein MST00_00440 [Tenericutes bacterium]|nr:hypothetical protein [Mycoplasmatota bacterium]
MEIMFTNETNNLLNDRQFLSFIGEVKDLETLLSNLNLSSYKETKKVKHYLKTTEYFNDLKLDNELLNKKIADLSSYELMCFKLLTIINKKPSIIILDNVDCKICEKYKSKLLNFIRLINASKRIKFIIISSNTVFLNQISKDCLVMKNGIIKYQGQIIEGIKSDQIKKCEIIDFIDIANQKKNAKLDYYLETKELLKAIYRSVF